MFCLIPSTPFYGPFFLFLNVKLGCVDEPRSLLINNYNWIVAEDAYLFANPFFIMIQRISWMLEVEFLAAEDSIQVSGQPKRDCP